MEINTDVVEGLPDFNLSPAQSAVAPPYATSACLSVSLIAPWTNRVPEHEPWPRQLSIDTKHINDATDEYKRNVRHNQQHDPDSPAGKKKISKLDGDFNIVRGKYWRR